MSSRVGPAPVIQLVKELLKLFLLLTKSMCEDSPAKFESIFASCMYPLTCFPGENHTASTYPIMM